MNKTSVRLTLILFAFILPGFSTSAQKKSYTDYYFEAKKLTDSLKTYKILIQAHGETYPFVSNGYVKNEVAKSFNFLNIKNPVDTNPDFVIKIVVSDVKANADYAYTGKANENETYEIILIYDVSFALSFETNEKPVVFIPLCTKKHYEKRLPYFRKSSEYDPKADRFQQIPKPEENKPVSQYADEWEIFLNTRSSFINDFNEVLVKFRKKK
jgi:hypothetical protein